MGDIKFPNQPKANKMKNHNEINQGIIEFNHYEEDYYEDHKEFIISAQAIVDAEKVIDYIFDSISGYETEEEMAEMMAEVDAIRKEAYGS